jgi:cobalt/nickel transport system ATP-binding protein
LICEKKVFELDDATFAYSLEAPVLKNISITINEGERVCILGVNGCGKSTLLKIFSGLLFPQTGTFTAFDTAINEKKLSGDKFSKFYHKKVGFIFQDSDVQLFCSTVEEEIAFGLLQQGLSQTIVKQRIDDITSMLSIEHLINKAPFKLSGGEKKKVALAAVLVTNPDVLILDEPTNGLDPRTQRWLVNLLIELNKMVKTLIVSTHNLELVSQISDRALLFDENHFIVADMQTDALLNNADLLKSVNLVDENYHN